ncbi:MAG: hypothetical protein IPJ07_14420 [Acidobacteria bacterium]|nr:hypothetical protein [Acidobacteriota bacterium]
MAWYRLAKLAFRLICDQTKTTNDEELANRLVDLVEKINPERTTIERICKELSLDSPERRKFINAYDVILTLFQQEDKSQALAFVRKLAQPEISGEQSEDLQTWLEQTPFSFEGEIPNSPDDRTPRPKRRLNIEQYGSPDEREIKGANQYLLGERFVGRKKELVDLTDWLGREGDRILCICDLGGTGKSALVWHWLNSESTKRPLMIRELKKPYGLRFMRAILIRCSFCVTWRRNSVERQLLRVTHTVHRGDFRSLF